MLMYVRPESLYQFFKKSSHVTSQSPKTISQCLLNRSFPFILKCCSSTCQILLQQKKKAEFSLPPFNPHFASRILRKFENDKDIRRAADMHGITELKADRYHFVLKYHLVALLKVGVEFAVIGRLGSHERFYHDPPHLKPFICRDLIQPFLEKVKASHLQFQNHFAFYSSSPCCQPVALRGVSIIPHLRLCKCNFFLRVCGMSSHIFFWLEDLDLQRLHGISTKQYALDALIPLFLDHSHDMYPLIKNHHKLKKISDLSEPVLWYPKARSISRHITYHAGPTNSGKTHAALERFLEADSAVYCSPLRLLAREVCEKSRGKGVACDMITGDDRDFEHENQKTRAQKTACTIEMTNINKRYDVAVIDEIQMLSDLQRGWAWTRAFLGLCCEEIHVCGEERALNMITRLTYECDDEISVVKYQRLGQLRVKKKPVETIDKLKPGDCVICFNKEQIYNYKKRLAKAGIEAAIIYGYLPPQTKLEEARKFNDPNHPCSILVTTDAIGMGLNLNIKRIIFNDLMKKTLTETGEKKTVQLTPSQALQIAGRAGRFGSQYPDGAVTAMFPKDQKKLHYLLKVKPDTIKAAGIHPSFEKIEQFAFAMNTTSLSDVLSIFISMCETEKLYFLCSLKTCQEVAEALCEIKIPLKDMYTFCLSPISPKRESVLAVIKVFASFFANDLEVTETEVKTLLDWPPRLAKNKEEMTVLEDMHECLRLFLWLSYRFPKIFVEAQKVRKMRKVVDVVTHQSVSSNFKNKGMKNSPQSSDFLWEDLNDFLLNT